MRRYAARHGLPQGRVAKLVLIDAAPPILVKTLAIPGGLPIEVFDGLRQLIAENRSQFYVDFPSGPFFGYNRVDALDCASHGGGSCSGHDGHRAGLWRVGIDQIQPAEIAEIVSAFPRLGMKDKFAQSCRRHVETKPETSYDNFLRDFGERFVPGCRPISPSIYC